MSAVAEIIKDRILYVVIALGLGSGLIGAYGRERHEGRVPDGNWWLSRICIIPFLGIVASFSVDQFGLTVQQASFLSAVLALMGYEAVRMILDRAKLKGQEATKILGDVVAADVPAGPRPYHSVIDTDAAGRATAHVEETDPKHPRRGALGHALRQTFEPPAGDSALDTLLNDGMGDIPGVG